LIDKSINWIVPMEPILSTEIIETEGFIHQVKWDGIRGLCYVNNGKVRVFTRKGRERTAFYPELASLASLFRGRNAIFDGEIIILNDKQRPSFQLSLIREQVSNYGKVNFYAKKYPAQYIVFDLIWVDDQKITNKPLYERGSILREKLDTNSVIGITDNFDNGLHLFSLMKQRGWEGIVSKKYDSPYLSGKNHNFWYKTKLSRRILAIVAGLTLKDGNPNSLVLALWQKGNLAYIGRASIGLTQEHINLLKDYVPLLQTNKNPFTGMSNTQTCDGAESKNSIINVNRRNNAVKLANVVWLNLRLTVWVSFLEWTSEGGLRHPKIVGFSALEPEAADGTEFVE
jgi:bifunctional non-homologous end joining protein LigD